MTETGTLIRLGVSQCLLGDAVRYDGRDKRHPWICGPLAAAAELVPLCPETGIGLPVPRPPIVLRGDRARPEARVPAQGERDLSTALRAHARSQRARLQALDGFILKARSPSCGLDDVPLLGPHGGRRGTTSGLFAAELRTWSGRPLVSEAGLSTPAARRAFAEAVHLCHQWRAMAAGRDPARARAFLQRYRLLLMAHGRRRYRALLAAAEGLGEAGDGCPGALLALLRHPATRRRRLACLRRLQRQDLPPLDPARARQVAQAIEGFAAGDRDHAATLARLRRLLPADALPPPARALLHPEPALARLLAAAGNPEPGAHD